MNEFPISRSKVTPPPVREETLSRERLLSWLDAAVLRRVVFVVAEAGYGKTTLLADFTRRSRVRCLWFKLDEPDRDWLTFLHYLVAAGREAVPDFAPATSALLAQSGDSIRDAAIQSFASELEQIADQPTTFIFDDYHLVDGQPDVNRIVQRMIRAAPERMSLVFLTRRRPLLRVARLHALDEIRELGREDLRFRRDETERLFSDAYQQPLEADVLEEVDTRTEGWAASLQLLRSSLKGRSPSEVRAFVGRLSGAEGRLYDYLAEEVVGDLPEPLRRFLIRTAVLDRLTPELARAALTIAGGPTPTPHEVRALIQRAEALGLLSRRGESSRWSHRYHPLIREYLLGKLGEQLDAAEVRELHRTIAGEAEATSWAVAAHHWLEAGEASEVVATVERQISSIASSGQYSLAGDYLSRAKVDGTGEIASIVQARIDLLSRRPDKARENLNAVLLDPDGHSSETLLLCLSIASSMGDKPAGSTLARLLLERSDIESWQAAIARATLALLDADLAGKLGDAIEVLGDAAVIHERQRRWHLAAISRFNLADIRLEAGQYREAEADARTSIEHLRRSGGDAAELGPAFALLGLALAAGDNLDEAGTTFEEARRESRIPLYAFEVAVRYAEYLVDVGRLDEGLTTVRRAVGEVGGAPMPNVLAMIATSGVDVATKAYAFGTADDWIGKFDLSQPAGQVAGIAHQKLSRARLSLLLGRPNAREQAHEAVVEARDQGAWHLAWRAMLLVASSAPNSSEALRGAIAECGRNAPSALRSEAAVLTSVADRLDPLPTVLETSMKSFPAAWRPHFRHRMDDRNPHVRLANAELLDRFGEWEDVHRLRQVARQSTTRRAGSTLGKNLARRTAPRAFVHDLGRMTVGVGDRLIEATSMRRKVAGFIAYLLTRPGFTATREQALEALWPDSPPDVGTNSLHQTIYFLRRELEPTYAEGDSPGYVHLEGELVWLDPELLDSASRRFVELVSHSRGDLACAVEAIQLYRGRFAPEFEYEEWAISTREALHAAYLDLVERTVRALASNGDWLKGAETARQALAVDPSAEGIEKNLISIYHHSGSHSAAAEQYAHFAAAQRSEYGVEPPPLQTLLDRT